MNGTTSPSVIIHGSKKYTPRRNPMKTPAVFGLFSHARIDLFQGKMILNYMIIDIHDDCKYK